MTFLSGSGKLSLDEIIAGCVRHDERCQRMLFDRCAPKIMTICRRYETTAIGARDILQETFITVFNKIALYDATRASIDTWINRIAIHTALRALRKEKLQFVDLELIPDRPDDNPDTELLYDYTEAQLLDMIQTLPAGYRTVFNLYVIDGFSHAEIADSMGISVQTSKSQLFKAKALLKKQILAEKKTHHNQYRYHERYV